MTVVRGWCPTLAEPMLTGDGWLARVRPPAGVVRDPAAFAAACLRWGNGIVEVTSRGALQVRGLREPALFADAMRDLGLADDDDRVVTAPLFRHDVSASLAGLPPKVFVAVDGGSLPMGDIGADITVRDGWVIVGGLGARGDASAIIASLARAFLRLDPAPRRFRETDAAALFAATGLTATPVAPVRAASVIGLHATGFVAGLPFGVTDATTLAALARLSGDGSLHLCPWRAFLLPGAGDVTAEVADLGLIADANDPRLRVAACPGSPACASGSVPARADAAALRPERGRVHVSGCVKGCAHPGVADITLVGRDGLYDLVRDGRADATPALRGLNFAEAVAAL